MAEAGKNTDNSCVYEVEKVIDRRKTRLGKIQYLVRWKDFASNDDTWEPLSNLANCRKIVDEFNDRFYSKESLDDVSSEVLEINGNIAGKKTARRNLKSTKRNFNKTDNGLNHRTTKRQRKDANSTVDLSLMNGHVPNERGPKRTRKESAADGESGNKSLIDVGLNGNPSNCVNNIHTTSGRSSFNRSFSVSTNHTPAKSNPESDVATPARRHRFLSLRSSDEKFYREDHPMSPTHTSIMSPINNIFSRTLSEQQLSPIVKLCDIQSTSSRPVRARYDRGKPLHAHQEGDEKSSGKDKRVSLRRTDCLYKFKEIVVRKGAGYTQVWFFTSSTVRNSLNPKVFNELTTILTHSKNDSSSVFLLHGAGNIFCSGVDLRFLAHHCNDTRKKAARQMAEALRKFIDALINFPKIIVAAVNGAATGLGTAILPLCDIVYASDKAVFSTPYGSLAQVPEGCSSLTLPTIMGNALANEMLIGGRKLTALEAYACGLVSHVFWPTSLMQEVIPRVQSIVANSSKAMQMSKSLIRGNNRAKMENANESECSMLARCWSSVEGYKAMQRYIEKNKDVFI